MSNFATLTPEQARAAATGYGWNVLPHDNGGFFAHRGPHQMIVTFAPDGSFRHASVREGANGPEQLLPEGAVIAELVMRGAGPVRPDEEPT
ncbi:hypothetical protein [Streptomyces sp. NPDC093060]